MRTLVELANFYAAGEVSRKAESLVPTGDAWRAMYRKKDYVLQELRRTFWPQAKGSRHEVLRVSPTARLQNALGPDEPARVLTQNFDTLYLAIDVS